MFSQGCLPEGIVFTTQEQINNFQTNYPGCIKIEGDVFINSFNNITDLLGLECLIEIDGDLDVESNYQLSTLEGLHNLVSISGSIDISDNSMLDNIDHLSNVTSIPGTIKIRNNDVLTNINELENADLSNIDNLYILDNPQLSNCAVQSICNFLAVPNGNTWVSVNALGCSNVEEIGYINEN